MTSAQTANTGLSLRRLGGEESRAFSGRLLAVDAGQWEIVAEELVRAQQWLLVQWHDDAARAQLWATVAVQGCLEHAQGGYRLRCAPACPLAPDVGRGLRETLSEGLQRARRFQSRPRPSLTPPSHEVSIQWETVRGVLPARMFAFDSRSVCLSSENGFAGVETNEEAPPRPVAGHDAAVAPRSLVGRRLMLHWNDGDNPATVEWHWQTAEGAWLGCSLARPLTTLGDDRLFLPTGRRLPRSICDGLRLETLLATFLVVSWRWWVMEWIG